MRKKGLSNAEFLARVQEYLVFGTLIYETDDSGNTTRPVSLDCLEENTFYHFDSDALLALTQAIEELALEEADGRFLASIQDGDQFQQHRERYWQLAATLDDVQIVASSKLLRTGSLKFCHDAKAIVKSFWMAIYEGKRFQALLLCRQANKAKKFEEKEFTGFYTFNPRVIAQAREDMSEALGGRCPDLRQFGQLEKIDRATKRLKVDFARESKAIELALKKLQSRHPRYQQRHFLADLNKTLERLNRLQTHLPELIVGKND